MVKLRRDADSDAIRVGVLMADTCGGFDLHATTPARRESMLGPFATAGSSMPEDREAIAAAGRCRGRSVDRVVAPNGNELRHDGHRDLLRGEGPDPESDRTVQTFSLFPGHAGPHEAVLACGVVASAPENTDVARACFRQEREQDILDLFVVDETDGVGALVRRNERHDAGRPPNEHLRRVGILIGVGETRPVVRNDDPETNSACRDTERLGGVTGSVDEEAWRRDHGFEIHPGRSDVDDPSLLPRDRGFDSRGQFVGRRSVDAAGDKPLSRDKEGVGALVRPGDHRCHHAGEVCPRHAAKLVGEVRPWFDEHLHRSATREAEAERVFVAQPVDHEARRVGFEDGLGVGSDISLDTPETHRTRHAAIRRDE